MNRWIVLVAAAFLLAACNKNAGPEYSTPAEFGAVGFYPSEVRPDRPVTVSVPVTSRYGFSRIFIVYALNGDRSDVRQASPRMLTREITSLTYEGDLPKQRAGTKVTFQVCAVTAYGVSAFSATGEYTVGAADGSGADAAE